MSIRRPFLLLTLSLGLTGCVGYVQGDGGDVVVSEPDTFVFWGYDDGGHRYRDYGRRGAESRGDAGRSHAAAPHPAPRGASASPPAHSGGVSIVPAAPSVGHSGGGGRR